MKNVRSAILLLVLCLIAGGNGARVIAQEPPPLDDVLRQARDLAEGGRIAESLTMLDRAVAEREGSQDRLLFHKGWIQFTKQRDFTGAVASFLEIPRRARESRLADDAFYYAGFITQYHLNDSARAAELYREGYINYPEGDFRFSLADKLKQLEGDFPPPAVAGTGAAAIPSGLEGVTLGGTPARVSPSRRAPPETDIRDTSPRRPPGSQTVTMQFNEAPLRSFIQWVAEVTGRNFIIDDRVSGSLTVYSGKPLPFDEVYRIFLSILEVKGFAAVDAGNITKIVPRGSAAQAELPIVIDEDAYLPTDRIVTRIFRLTTISATAMQTLLRPFLSPNDQMLVQPESNSLVVTGPGHNIARIQEMIRIFDAARGTMELRSHRIQYGRATAIAEKVTALVQSFPPPGATPPPFRIIADERTNTVHVVTDAAWHQRVETLVAQMDVDKTPDRIVRVFTLEYAKADDVAKYLKELLGIGAADESIDYGGITRTVLIPDARLNAVSVSTFAPRVVELIESYIARIDRPPFAENRATRIVKLQYAQANEMFALLNSVFTEAATPSGAFALGLSEKISIAPDKRTNSIIVTSTAADWTKIRNLIDQLDQRKPQVLVDAVILETSLDEARALGFNITTLEEPKPGSTRILGGSVVLPVSELATGGLVATVSRGTTIGPALHALLLSSKTNVLQMPQVLALDNEPSTISVGDLTPIVTSRSVSADNVQIAGSSSIYQNVDYRNIGLNLKLTPHIGQKRDILLELDLEVQDRGAAAEGGLPVFTNRALKSKIQVADGDYVVLGGLLRSQDQRTQRATPWLSKLPVLGVLFQNTNSSEEKTVLLLFIRPRVVTDPVEMRDVTEEERLQFEAETRAGLRTRSELEKWIPESR